MAKPPAHLGYVTPAVVISALLLSLQTVFSGGVEMSLLGPARRLLFCPVLTCPGLKYKMCKAGPVARQLWLHFKVAPGTFSSRSLLLLGHKPVWHAAA